MRTIAMRRLFAGASLLSVSFLGTVAMAGPTIHVGAHATVTGPSARSLAAIEAHARKELTATSMTAARLGSALVRTSVDHFGDGDTLVRFEQSHLGLPVIGRGATVRLATAPARTVTTVDLEEKLPSSAVPSIDAASAAKTAGRLSPLAASADDAHLVFWPTRSGARLAWVVLPRVTGLPTAPRVVVDAESGKILEARDLVVFAKAQMYRTNPTKSPTLELLDLPIEPTGATLTSDFLDAVNCIDKKAVRPVKFYGFNQNMRACDLDQVATRDESGDFVTSPTDEPGSLDAKSDPFSEVSIYFHASKAYAYFRDLQGDPAAQVTSDKPLRLVANLQLPPGVSKGSFAQAGDPNKPLEPFSNAFFSPATGGMGDLFAQLYNYNGGALWFGQGPERDYAYDGDVVYHEFGHAVVDHTVRLGQWSADERGIVDAPGAMNEGLADYFSSAIAGDPDVGEYASKDMAPNMTVIRTLANQDKCPTSIAGEVHFDSTLFSGGLWQARSALANDGDKKKFDAALYKALRTNPGRSDLGYTDMVKLFMATLGTDFPAGAAALDAAMTARGVLPTCERILSFEGKELRSPYERAGFAAPSGQQLGLDVAPGIVQVKAKVAAWTSKVTFAVATLDSARGGGGFGGGGTFAPTVLVKFGKPISWKEGKGGLVDDADAKKELEASVTFDVPESATETEVYFQIVNTGDADGSYDGIDITSTPGTAPPPEDAPGDPAAPSSATETQSGCACTTPGTPPARSGTSALALLALGAVVGLRRRR